MEKIIKAANDEFKKNGRSDLFIAIEDGVLAKCDAMQTYYFARYVRGADTSKCQQAVLRYGDLEQMFYFQQFIPKSKVAPFINKAVDMQNKFWVSKFIQLVQRQFDVRHMSFGDEIEEMESETKLLTQQINDYDRETRRMITELRSKGSMLGYSGQELKELSRPCTERLHQLNAEKHLIRRQIRAKRDERVISASRKKLVEEGVSEKSLAYIDANSIISEIEISKAKDNINFEEHAMKEYACNGRSAQYIELERYAMYHFGVDVGYLFAKHVPEASLTDFERVALLRGDPFNMFLLATQVPGINKQKMLQGMQLSKYDYVNNARELKRQIANKKALNESIIKLENILKHTQEESEVAKLNREINNDIAKRDKISETIPNRIADIVVRWTPAVERLVNS